MFSKHGKCSQSELAKRNYPKYSTHQNIVVNHLTPKMYEKLFMRVTPNGVTLDRCIQPSVDSLEKTEGLVAGDEESYEVFKELFDAVINERHHGFGPKDKHPEPELVPENLKDGQLDDKYVKSCRVRTGRSIKGICLPACISRGERREVETLLTDALSQLTGELAGTYYPMNDMTREEEQRLIDDHFLFKKPTEHLMVPSGAARDWPDARGIWHNDNKTFLLWINEEDHCRIISMENGGNMTSTFTRFCKGLGEIERIIKEKGYQFMWNKRLGYLCTCPSNIGTGIRCSCHVRLEQLTKDFPRFDTICTAMELQWRGTGGEFTDTIDFTYDISNSARLKSTERQFVQQVIDGVKILVHLEKTLEGGKSIDNLVKMIKQKKSLDKILAQ